MAKLTFIKYLLLFSLVITSGFVGCKTKKVDSKPYEMIKMQRGACFGACPMFTISISSDGRAELIGERFLDKIGIYQKTIDKNSLSTLQKAFIDSKFFDFKDEYTANITDLPTTYLTFTHEGKTKMITDYYNTPEKIHQLEKLVDEIVQKNDWVKKSDIERK